MAGSRTVEKPEKRIPEETPTLAVGSKFDKYGPEEEIDVRKYKVTENETVRRLKNIWRTNSSYITDLKGDDYYSEIYSYLIFLDYSAKDVEEFSIILAQFQDEDWFSYMSGYFLSALINKGKDEEYVIHTRHLAELPDNIGHKNCKNITVKGNVRRSLGHSMKGGSIVVEGDAEDRAGQWMEGGDISIKGNARDEAGYEMKGGSLTVKGDAEDQFGKNMRDGNLTVEGNACYGVGYGMRGGAIIVRGNADSEVGGGMRGGQIQIDGDIGRISEDMEDGMIFHKGDRIA